MADPFDPLLQVTIAILFLVLLVIPDLMASDVDLEREKSDRIDLP